MTLTCETRLPPQRSEVPLRFCFFREQQALGSGCSGSPELQIPAVWREDARSYWCQAQTVTLSVTKKSPRSHILVRSECLGALRSSRTGKGRAGNASPYLCEGAVGGDEPQLCGHLR